MKDTENNPKTPLLLIVVGTFIALFMAFMLYGFYKFVLKDGYKACETDWSTKEDKALKAYVVKLNAYANQKYADSNKTCEDFKNKVVSIETLGVEPFRYITIEIENKKVSLREEDRPISISKNALVDLLNNEANLKSNIDKYIEECK